MAEHELGTLCGRADSPVGRHEEVGHARVVRHAHRLHQVHAGLSTFKAFKKHWLKKKCCDGNKIK